MTEFTIRIAGKAAAISALFPSTRDYCSGFLCTGAPDYQISLQPEDISFEREKSLREEQMEQLPPRNFSDAYLETVALQRKIAEELFRFDTLLFHGSALSMDGSGFLFTARSGTGKSTHTRLWREAFGSRVQMVNDDKPFLLIGSEGVQVCGSPWNGKHNLGSNIQVPLKAICLLERSETNSIHPIPTADALFMLLQQSNRPIKKELMEQYMWLIDALAKNVSFFRLRCNMDSEAALVAHSVLGRL